MGRIRAVFVLLAVVLLVPVGLLVDRALESIEVERRVSHQAVAERLFDEMERQLSEFLRAEEERPFAAYGAGDAMAGAVAPYVSGYFEIDPEGGFRSFPAPDRQGPAGASAATSAEKLETTVRRGLVARPSDRPERHEPPGPTSPRKEAADIEHWFAADSVAPLQKGDRDGGAGAEPVRPAESKRVSPYAALQSLNRAAQDRGERQVKRAAKQAAAAGRADDAPREAIELEGDAFDLAASGRIEERADGLRGAPHATAAPQRALESVGPGASPAEPATLRRKAPGAPAFGDERRERSAATDPALEVHPMAGRLIDPEQLLLYRTVFVDGRRYRQGLVVQVAELFAGLDEVIAGSPNLAPYVRRQFYTLLAPEQPPWRSSGFEYVHDFAEPFDGLTARLRLALLPGVASANYLYAIAALLLVSAPLGLFALYRMVAVMVRFAERRNNFVAAVSHELKTPLTAIRMHAEMLRDDMVPDEAKRREYYGTITAESERLTRLINNVLEFSRLEQGTREASLTVGAVAPVVAEAAELLRPHAREGGFDLDVEIEDGLPPVRYDRDAVLQVVFNLVDNAIKYARDAGDRRIRIRCAREGEGVVVAVRDRGRGVEARHLGHIFEPFYRGGSELTRAAKGTGIGLALVRGLADTMGAAVSGRNLGDGGFEVSLRFRAAAG